MSVYTDERVSYVLAGSGRSFRAYVFERASLYGAGAPEAEEGFSTPLIDPLVTTSADRAATDELAGEVNSRGLMFVHLQHVHVSSVPALSMRQRRDLGSIVLGSRL